MVKTTRRVKRIRRTKKQVHHVRRKTNRRHQMQKHTRRQRGGMGFFQSFVKRVSTEKLNPKNGPLYDGIEVFKVDLQDGARYYIGNQPLIQYLRSSIPTEIAYGKKIQNALSGIDQMVDQGDTFKDQLFLDQVNFDKFQAKFPAAAGAAASVAAAAPVAAPASCSCIAAALGGGTLPTFRWCTAAASARQLRWWACGSWPWRCPPPAAAAAAAAALAGMRRKGGSMRRKIPSLPC